MAERFVEMLAHKPKRRRRSADRCDDLSGVIPDRGRHAFDTDDPFLIVERVSLPADANQLVVPTGHGRDRVLRVRTRPAVCQDLSRLSPGHMRKDHLAQGGAVQGVPASCHRQDPDFLLTTSYGDIQHIVGISDTNVAVSPVRSAKCSAISDAERHSDLPRKNELPTSKARTSMRYVPSPFSARKRRTF